MSAGHEACEWYDVGKAAALEDFTKVLQERSGKAFIADDDSKAQLLRELAHETAALAKRARADQKTKAAR